VAAAAPFSRVGIVGLGLIGGSVALASRAGWPGSRLVAIDPSGSADEALRRGVVDETARSLSEAPPADLVLLAAPLATTMAMLPDVRRAAPDAIVMDVGSTKRRIMAAAAAARLSCFIGGHPMAGSERSGLDQARADLFRGRPWLLIAGHAPEPACRRAEQFVEGLGARPRWMEAEAHDRAVAYLSHLPQVIAVALMHAAAEGAGDHGFAARGRAFEEMTRLASSPAGMWREVLADNADFVSEALAVFARDLPGRADLADATWVERMFARADALRRGEFGPSEET
jgi:prephenate dehydrogenase